MQVWQQAGTRKDSPHAQMHTWGGGGTTNLQHPHDTRGPPMSPDCPTDPWPEPLPRTASCCTRLSCASVPWPRAISCASCSASCLLLAVRLAASASLTARQLASCVRSDDSSLSRAVSCAVASAADLRSAMTSSSSSAICGGCGGGGDNCWGHRAHSGGINCHTPQHARGLRQRLQTAHSLFHPLMSCMPPDHLHHPSCKSQSMAVV